MNNSQVINAGVAELNKDRSASVVSKAKNIIVCIESTLASIALHEKHNATDAAELKKLETLDVTYENIVGGTAPTSPNANQKTILETLKKMNDERQSSVATRSKAFTENIVARKTNIENCNKEIARLREELGKLEVSEVAVAEIVG